MNPPSRPIRAELNDALVGGIRLRGPEAFGMIIYAFARLLVAVVAFFIFFGLTKLAGQHPASFPAYLGLTGASGLTSWLVTRKPASAHKQSDDAEIG